MYGLTRLNLLCQRLVARHRVDRIVSRSTLASIGSSRRWAATTISAPHPPGSASAFDADGDRRKIADSDEGHEGGRVEGSGEGDRSFVRSTGQLATATAPSSMSLSPALSAFSPDPSSFGRRVVKTGPADAEVGAGVKVPFKVKKSQRYHFAAAGVEPKVRIRAFQVTEDAILPPGTEITAMHFRPGQHVDAQAVTRGRGFQGAMRRWGFGGQNATHGVTKAHRSIGSTGTRKIKTKKGRKMAGRMGGHFSTSENIEVYKVDGINNLLYVKGVIPGPAGRWVLVRDANRSRAKEGHSLPFPTKFTLGDEKPEDLILTADGANRHVEESQLFFK